MKLVDDVLRAQIFSQSFGVSTGRNSLLALTQTSGVSGTISSNQASSTFSGTSFGSGAGHNNVQPTIVLSKIIRII